MAVLTKSEKRDTDWHGTPFAIGKTTNFDAYWHYTNDENHETKNIYSSS